MSERTARRLLGRVSDSAVRLLALTDPAPCKRFGECRSPWLSSSLVVAGELRPAGAQKQQRRRDWWISIIAGG